MARKRTISRSISFTENIDKQVCELADTLFSGNVSATVGYIVSKYFVEESKPQQTLNIPQPKKSILNSDLTFLED